MDEVILNTIVFAGVLLFAVFKYVHYSALEKAEKHRSENEFDTQFFSVVWLFVGLFALLNLVVPFTASLQNLFLTDLMMKSVTIVGGIVLIQMGWLFLERVKYRASKVEKKPPEPEKEPEPQHLKLEVEVPEQVRKELEVEIAKITDDRFAQDSFNGFLQTLVDTLPDRRLIGGYNSSTQWIWFIQDKWDENDEIPRALGVLDREETGFLKEKIEKTYIPIKIPDELRTEHQQIVSRSGYGKTQLIQSMILDDLEQDCSIVVIDSQSEMINKLAERVEPDRLILVDPETCPPALNLFSGQEGEKATATVVELYEYIFSALDAQMTSKQQTAYRFVTRLLLVIPNANIHTMREILEPGQAHQEYVSQLDQTAQSFFYNEFNSRQFAETRSQILRRLYTVLESTTLSKMLGSTESSLDMDSALNSGKVILVSTAKNFLKQTGASLFGRIFIAQVMQSVMDRTDNRKRTYLYIDEFQDYAEESHVLFNLFEQARKYNLGIIVAHQYLDQLPPKLRQSISANTAIKFAGGVSAQDRNSLGNQMGGKTDWLRDFKKGLFVAHFSGMGTVPYRAPFGRLEQEPVRESLESIQKRMRELYGVKYTTTETPLRQVAEPDSEGDVIDRS